jgi:CheY-like chemotaxis protein
MKGPFMETKCLTEQNEMRMKKNLSSGRKKILIVDDDASVRFLIKDAFSICTSNWDAMTAGNGLEAIRILQSDMRVDFILTDMDMPVMSGYELVSHLKKNHPDIPFLVMTGATTHECTHILSQGFLDCVVKPFNVIDLIERVTGMIGVKGSHPPRRQCVRWPVMDAR